MHAYIDFVNYVIHNGTSCEERTGTGMKAINGTSFKHNMADGFPLLQTKKINLKNIAVELDMFLKGVTDRRFLHAANCKIWDHWTSPTKAHKDDLGPIYGYQWRSFNGDVNCDQIRFIVHELKNNPNSRRLLCSAWNPLQTDEMALPPCHFAFQLMVRPGLQRDFLDLVWYQRSVDVCIGLPYDLASYALLLLLFCNCGNFVPGYITGLFGSTHIYNNHIEPFLLEQLPRVNIEKGPVSVNVDFMTPLDFDYNNVSLHNYSPEPFIKYEVAV